MINTFIRLLVIGITGILTLYAVLNTPLISSNGLGVFLAPLVLALFWSIAAYFFPAETRISISTQTIRSTLVGLIIVWLLLLIPNGSGQSFIVSRLGIFSTAQWQLLRYGVALGAVVLMIMAMCRQGGEQ